MFGEIAGALIGGLLQSDATSDAADAQSAATAAGIAENRRQFDLTRSDFAPYRTVGTNALRRLAAFYQLPAGADMGSPTASSLRQQLIGSYTTPATPDRQEVIMPGGREADPVYRTVPGTPATVNEAGLQAAIEQALAGGGGAPAQYDDELSRPLQMDPGYQFGLDEGNKALDRKIAAAGGRVSGAAIKAAQRFGTDYATTGYSAAYQRRQDTLNRLQALAGIGQTSTGASAAAGQSAANANANLLSSMGNAQGAAALNQGSIWGNAINQAGAAWQRGQRQGYGTPGYWPSDQGMSWGYDK